jgi:Flp pilus assembly protein TadG
MKNNALKNQRGASAVEFAILLPLLALLIFGVIEFGILFYNQQVLTNASREGARAAIVGTCLNRLDDSRIAQIVNDYCRYSSAGNIVDRLVTFAAAKQLPSTSVTPNPRGCGSGVGLGTDLTVTVTYDYAFLAPGILGLGTKKTLTATTVMKMESNEN